MIPAWKYCTLLGGNNPTTRLLDIGGGRVTTAVLQARQYGCQVVAIDISSDMVETARQQHLGEIQGFRINSLVWGSY